MTLNRQVSPWDATAAAAVAAIAVAVRTPRCRGDGVSTAVRPPAGPGIVELLSQLRNAFDTQETWVKDSNVEGSIWFNGGSHGIPKSPWASILDMGNDLMIWGHPHGLEGTYGGSWKYRMD